MRKCTTFVLGFLILQTGCYGRPTPWPAPELDTSVTEPTAVGAFRSVEACLTYRNAASERAQDAKASKFYLNRVLAIIGALSGAVVVGDASEGLTTAGGALALASGVVIAIQSPEGDNLQQLLADEAESTQAYAAAIRRWGEVVGHAQQLQTHLTREPAAPKPETEDAGRSAGAHAEWIRQRDALEGSLAKAIADLRTETQKCRVALPPA